MPMLLEGRHMVRWNHVLYVNLNDVHFFTGHASDAFEFFDKISGEKMKGLDQKHFPLPCALRAYRLNNRSPAACVTMISYISPVCDTGTLVILPGG